MRVLVGLLGVLLCLPFVAIGVFQRNFPPDQRRAAGLMGLASGACCIAAVGSMLVPSWERAGVIVLAIVATVYAVLWVGNRFSRHSAERDKKRARE